MNYIDRIVTQTMSNWCCLIVFFYRYICSFAFTFTTLFSFLKSTLGISLNVFFITSPIAGESVVRKAEKEIKS